MTLPHDAMIRSDRSPSAVARRRDISPPVRGSTAGASTRRPRVGRHGRAPVRGRIPRRRGQRERCGRHASPVRLLDLPRTDRSPASFGCRERDRGVGSSRRRLSLVHRRRDLPQRLAAPIRLRPPRTRPRRGTHTRGRRWRGRGHGRGGRAQPNRIVAIRSWCGWSCSTMPAPWCRATRRASRPFPATS